MLPATMSGMVARFEAISSTCASRFSPEATSSTMIENGRVAIASASVDHHRGRLLAHLARALRHRPQLAEGDVARQVHAAAVGIDHQPLGGNDVERPADAIGDDARRLDLVRLDVDDAEAERERHVEFLEQPQVVLAAPRELQRDGLHLGVENQREQIAVAAFERRLAVAVAVADVQRDVGLDALDHRVHGADRPRQILGEAGVVRLVDLQVRGAGAHHLAQLGVQHPGQIERERLLRLGSARCGSA